MKWLWLLVLATGCCYGRLATQDKIILDLKQRVTKVETSQKADVARIDVSAAPADLRAEIEKVVPAAPDKTLQTSDLITVLLWFDARLSAIEMKAPTLGGPPVAAPRSILSSWEFRVFGGIAVLVLLGVLYYMFKKPVTP